MGASRTLLRGDVLGLVSGALSGVALAANYLFAVELGALSLASSILGVALGAYALAWFAFRAGCYLWIAPSLEFALREGANGDEALVRIRNTGRRPLRLREVQALYVHGQNELEVPQNADVRNQYRVEQGYFLDGPTLSFQVAGQTLELGRALETSDEIRCTKLDWGADVSPTAYADVGLDLARGRREQPVVPLLWLRVYPEITVSQVLSGVPGVVDRVFEPIPLRKAGALFPPGVSPRVFGTEYAEAMQPPDDVTWPSRPET